jgi:hypothetical protein
MLLHFVKREMDDAVSDPKSHVKPSQNKKKDLGPLHNRRHNKRNIK